MPLAHTCSRAGHPPSNFVNEAESIQKKNMVSKLATNPIPKRENENWLGKFALPHSLSLISLTPVGGFSSWKQQPEPEALAARDHFPDQTSHSTRNIWLSLGFWVCLFVCTFFSFFFGWDLDAAAAAAAGRKETGQWVSRVGLGGIFPLFRVLRGGEKGQHKLTLFIWSSVHSIFFFSPLGSVVVSELKFLILYAIFSLVPPQVLC